MGDMGDFWRDIKGHRAEMRAKHGVPCPRCPDVRPKTNPTILLPGQRCKVDGYVDPRKRIEE